VRSLLSTNCEWQIGDSNDIVEWLKHTISIFQTLGLFFCNNPGYLTRMRPLLLDPPKHRWNLQKSSQSTMLSHAASLLHSTFIALLLNETIIFRLYTTKINKIRNFDNFSSLHGKLNLHSVKREHSRNWNARKISKL